MGLLIPATGLLFWMALSFGLICFLLVRFGFPVITGMVEKRREEIDSALEEAAQAKIAVSELQATMDRMMREAKTRQQEMLRETEALRLRLVEEAKEAARLEADKVLEAGRKQVQEEREAARKEVKAQVAVLAVEVAEKVLRARLDAQPEQLRLVDKILEETRMPNA